MIGDDRARLTIPDVVFLLMSLAFLGVLYPVFWDLLQKNAGEVGTGGLYLFQLVLPLGILVMLSLVWSKTIGGSA